MVVSPPPRPNTHIINIMDLDPREEYLKERLVPMKDFKRV